MRPWLIGCVVLLSFLSHGPGVAFSRSCLATGPRYALATDTVEWSMRIGSGQHCIQGLRFSDIAIEYVRLVSLPQSGEVIVQGPSFTYTARSQFQGWDAFAISVSGLANRKSGSSTIR